VVSGTLPAQQISYYRGQAMTLEDYVDFLEMQVNPAFVEKVKTWPVDTKLYVYLHTIQLAHMTEFKRLLEEHQTK